MQRLSSFSARVAARWQRSWWNQRIELTDGVLGACGHERVQPKIAALGIVGLLLSQTLLPGAMLLGEVRAAELRQGEALAAQKKEREAQTPAWAKAVEARVAGEARQRSFRLIQGKRNNGNGNGNGNGNANVFNRPPVQPVPGSVPGQIAPSEEAECVDCEVTVVALDLTKVPSERALRRAGQLGGALNPTRPADPEELGFKLDKLAKRAGIEGGLGAKLPPKDPRARGLQRAKGKYERARAINLDFGKAIQEWNTHNYRQAAKMFEKHMKEFPESPWLGEAQLHLGCDAKYNGRFAEAQEIYSDLYRKTSDKPNAKLKKARKERKARGGKPDVAEMEQEVAQVAANSQSLEEAVVKLDAPDQEDDESFEIHQKSKQRWADLDIATGRWNSAAEKLANIIQTDTDWRRITWAQHWLRNLGSKQRNLLALRSCGPKALGVVMASLGKDEAAQKLKVMPAPAERGTDLEQLKRIAAQHGTPMEGFRGTPTTLEKLPLPLILHYDFGSDAAPKARVAAPQTNKAGGASPFRISERSGHFVVVKKVNAAQKQVTIFDPQEGRTFYLSYGQLKREWSGQGLMLSRAKAPAKAAQRLTKSEMKATVGGCCGLPSAPDDLGDGPNLDTCKVGPCGERGEPSVNFNRINMNMFVHDVPLWYDNAVGPSVEIGLSYNSQDAVTRHQPFGRKWSFNYGSYLVEDTAAGGGRVTVFMGDGSSDDYTPNGAGGYATEVDVHHRLEKVSGSRYILHLQDGSTWTYAIPANTNSQQPFLISQTDPWGNALTFTYAQRLNSADDPNDKSVLLLTITDALGRETKLNYSYNGEYQVCRVSDPFGRHASFSYDSNGNLTEVVDMEGQAFQYSYDNLARIVVLNTAMGPWKFAHEGPDGYGAGDSYPAPGEATWASARVTVSAPNNRKEEYFYYAGYDYPTDGIEDERSWHVDQNNYVEYQHDSHSNASSWVAKTQWDSATGPSNPGDTIGGKGKVRIASNAAGEKVYLDYDPNTGNPSTITDARGKTSTLTYNSQGLVTSVRDPKGQVTTLEYATNDLDVTGVVNANGVRVMNARYNAQHQPIWVSNESGISTFSYTSWGAPDVSVDPQGKATRYLYNNLGQVTAFQFADAPATTGGARQWQTLGGFTYDKVGRVRTVTDATNFTKTFTYDNLDKITKVSYSDGTSETTEYVCCGLPGVVTDRTGRKSYYDYDEMKRPKRVQDAQGDTLQMDYDLKGQPVRLIDGKGHLTKWQYDNAGRVTKKLYHDGTSEEFAYSQGLVSQSKNARGHVIKYGYDANSNLTLVDYPNMADVTVSYNALGQATQVTDGIGVHSFTYDNLGRINGSDGPLQNDAKSFVYDAVGRLQSQSVERGANGGLQSQSYTYDALERLRTLSSEAGVFTYNYVGNTGFRSSLEMPNGTRTDYGYDSLQRITSVHNQKGASTLSRYSYAYNNRDMRTGMQMQLGADPLRQVAYNYSSVDQLEGESATGGTNGFAYQNSFQYDAMGNRTRFEAVRNGTTTTTRATPNALNQLASLGLQENGGPRQNVGMLYDQAGNLTQTTNGDGSKMLYGYDDADRLTLIERRDATGTPLSKSEFLYDAFSNKVISREWSYAAGTWTKTGETRRVFAGLNVLQERNDQNQVVAQYTNDGNIDGILARTTGTATTVTRTYYGYDGSANVTLLTDSQGQKVGEYVYDAYGNTLQASGPRAAENPYRFSTKELHASSGLYDYGYRFYSPGLGRWINRDPIGEAGGLNQYGFNNNNPANYLDPDGACPMLITGAIGATAGGLISGGITWYQGGSTREIVASAGRGAFVGGVAGATGGLAGGAVSGMVGGGFWGGATAGVVGGVAGDVAGQSVEMAAGWRKCYDWKQTAMSGGIGGLMGGASAAKWLCFAAGTQVQMADGSTKPIEQVKEGDSVLSRDESSGKTEAKKVKRLFERQADATLLLHFSNGEKIETTKEHPFYVQGKGFTPAGELGIGTSIVTRAGPSVTLVSATPGKAQTVYNFEVEEFHSYFVGSSDGGLWVHNKCPDIALGKFTNPLTSRLRLAPFTKQTASNTGRPVTSFNDWTSPEYGVGKGDTGALIKAAMNDAKTIHFNLAGVNWNSAKSGTGRLFSAEWELNLILNNSTLAAKTRFYF